MRALGRFLLDFIVGDDPWIAAFVALALLGTLALSDDHVPAWWLLPLVVAVSLLLTILRVTANRR